MALSGNYVGLSLGELEQLSTEDHARKAETAVERLREAGADFVIDTVQPLEAVLDEIDHRQNSLS